MTNEEFCKIESMLSGEEITSVKQLTFRSFTGLELKEYISDFMELYQDYKQAQAQQLNKTTVNSNCNTLHLNLHRKWFDLIISGVKKEEYREIKPFWSRKFLLDRGYKTITFSNGYSKTRPQFVIEIKEILCGFGNPDFGAPKDKKVFIIKLGDIVSQNNYSRVPGEEAEK